jgi:hypothetical protein
MIYEKNCLFLFNEDLNEHYRFQEKDPGLISSLNLKMFLKKENDRKFSTYINNSKAIMYIDPAKNIIFHMTGIKKGKIEKY